MQRKILLLFTCIILFTIFGCTKSDSQLFDLAKENKDVNYCLQMKNELYLSSCIISLVGKEGVSADICEHFDKFNNINGKNKCYYEFATIYSDSNYCAKMESTDNPLINSKDDCYHDLIFLDQFGTKGFSSDICGNIENLEKRNKCYFYYGDNYRDSSACANILNVEGEDYITKEKCIEVS